MIKHYCTEWITEWCQNNGWTDLFIERHQYWAFPPGAVIPEPIPPDVLSLIKEEKGQSTQEKGWSIAAVVVSVMAIVLSYVLQSPMPIVLAFGFAAITVALLEVEEK
jgi:hypothetical protein